MFVNEDQAHGLRCSKAPCLQDLPAEPDKQSASQVSLFTDSMELAAPPTKTLPYKVCDFNEPGEFVARNV